MFAPMWGKGDFRLQSRPLQSKIKSSSLKPIAIKNFPSHAYAVVTLFHTNGSLAGPTRLHPQGKGGSR